MLLKLAFIVLLANTTYGLLNSRARQNFFCDDLLNRHIAKEFEISQIYLSLSSYFGQDRVALEGFHKMFKHGWKEELGHAQKLTEYGIMRGAQIETPSVAKPDDFKWEKMNVCQIVEYYLNLEKSINEHFFKLHKCGETDPQLQDFIESEFLKEQVETNKELADLLTSLERATLHVHSNGTTTFLCDGLGLHIVDKELANKFK